METILEAQDARTLGRVTRDLDGVLLLLASDAGRFMAGATITVDGGQILQIAGA